MRYLILTASLLVCGAIEAQSSDWKIVQALSPGTKVVVALGTRRGLSCRVERVSEDSLECSGGLRSFQFERLKITRIRSARTKAGAILGAFFGGAVGGATAAVNLDIQKQPASLLAGIGLGAAVGAGVGAIVGGAAGKTIYVHP